MDHRRSLKHFMSAMLAKCFPHEPDLQLASTPAPRQPCPALDGTWDGQPDQSCGDVRKVCVPLLTASLLLQTMQLLELTFSEMSPLREAFLATGSSGPRPATSHGPGLLRQPVPPLPCQIQNQALPNPLPEAPSRCQGSRCRLI